MPMMRPGTRLGRLSIVFGTLALLSSIALHEIDLRRRVGFSHLLWCMDRLGLIRQPGPDQIPEWKPLGALDFVYDHGLITNALLGGAMAMLVALWAKHRDEETLHLSLGFILGASAFHMRGFRYSMSALFVGAILLWLLERRHLAKGRAT